MITVKQGIVWLTPHLWFILSSVGAPGLSLTGDHWSCYQEHSLHNLCYLQLMCRTVQCDYFKCYFKWHKHINWFYWCFSFGMCCCVCSVLNFQELTLKWRLICIQQVNQWTLMGSLRYVVVCFVKQCCCCKNNSEIISLNITVFRELLDLLIN